MHAQTLYTDEGNFRAFKILIAAEYNETVLIRPPFKMMQDNLTEEFRRKSPLGKVPVLDTPQGAPAAQLRCIKYIRVRCELFV
jgi:elongation factor 1-gamma